MATKQATHLILDTMDDANDFSAILNTHDETGDVSADEFIKECCVAAGLAFCNSKVTEKDRGDYDTSNFAQQISRINDKVHEYYTNRESLEIVKAAVNLFIGDITGYLIMAIDDQSITPVFESIGEDLSIKFKLLGGKHAHDNSDGTPAG